MVRSLGLEDPLEKEKAIHSSILAWRIPRTEKLGELWSIVLEKVPFGKTPVKASMTIYHASNYRDGALGSESVSHSVMSDSLRPHGLPLSMEFSRQEYWSGFPCSPPGIFPIQGLNLCLLCLLHWQVGSLPLVPLEKPILGPNMEPSACQQLHEMIRLLFNFVTSMKVLENVEQWFP